MVNHEQISAAAGIMDRLWSAGGWESTQTHESLLPYLLEEAYELIDAVQAGDTAAIREELGDLLLQVLFHSRIAESNGEFTLDDVAADLTAKLTHRSPHLRTALTGSITKRIAAQEQAWEQAKASEKSRASCLDGIALTQPALALTEKILARAGKAGFPADLVPAELRTVSIGAGAELRVRAAALRFAVDIRKAEAAARAPDGIARPLSEQQWRAGWHTRL